MDMYMERILDLHKNPRNFGEIPDADAKKLDYNPSCGDMVQIFVKFSKDGKNIEDVKFKGRGCAISIASASLITDYSKGKKTGEVLALGQQDVFRIIGVDLSKNPSRVKCAMLPLTVLKKALAEK